MIGKSGQWSKNPGKVLVLHNYYQQRGGEDVAFENEVNAMRVAGWNVDTYEVSNDSVSKYSAGGLFVNTIWSADSGKALKCEIQRLRPDVVHIHNFFPLLSPSVHWIANQSGAAVVQTLHNFRLGCLSGSFFRNGKTCRDCLGKAPVLGVARRCYRGNLGASAALFSMLEFHRIAGTWKQAVDAYIALTGPSRDLLQEIGVPAHKVHVKPGVLFPDAGIGNGDGGYFLYVGRLTEEKGILTLLEAWESGEELPTLILVGTGPLEPVVREVASRCKRILPVGKVDATEVANYMKRARALVFASEWFENCPMVVVESMSCGTPVVSSDLPTIREMLGPGPHAHFFETGNSRSLLQAVRAFQAQSEIEEQVRLVARARFENAFSTAINIEKLSAIYDSALSLKSPSR